MALKRLLKNISLKNKLFNAAKAYQKNDFEQAKKIYLQILEIDPDNFKGLLWLGSLYSEMGLYSESITKLERCIEKNPTDMRPYHNLAILQAELQRYELSIETSEKALKSCKMNNNRRAEIYYHIGYINFKLKKYSEAIDFANKALKIRHNYQQAEQMKMNAFNSLKM